MTSLKRRQSTSPRSVVVLAQRRVATKRRIERPGECRELPGGKVAYLLLEPMVGMPLSTDKGLENLTEAFLIARACLAA
jgi:hypothetical protein